MALLCCTFKEFGLNVDQYVDLLKPGLRIEIGENDEKVVMIHPDDYNRLMAHQVKKVFEADELDLDKKEQKK